jgi:hypothetical protein
MKTIPFSVKFQNRFIHKLIIVHLTIVTAYHLTQKRNLYTQLFSLNDEYHLRCKRYSSFNGRPEDTFE